MSNNTNDVYFAEEIEAIFYRNLLMRCIEDSISAYLPLAHFLEFGLDLKLVQGDVKPDPQKVIPACLESEAFHDIVALSLGGVLMLYGAENIVPMTDGE